MCRLSVDFLFRCLNGYASQIQKLGHVPSIGGKGTLEAPDPNPDPYLFAIVLSVSLWRMPITQWRSVGVLVSIIRRNQPLKALGLY